MNKSYLNSVIKIISSSKPSSAIRLLLMVLFVSSFANVASAQPCNGSSGTVYSNTANMCVGGSTEQFWSDGWSGSTAFWSSSNPAVLTAVKNSSDGNATVTAIAAGTADVIYTYKQVGCPDKVSKKTVTVGSAVGAVSADQSICSGSSLTSNITISSATGTIQWKRADDAAFTTNVTNVGSNSKTLTIAQVGTLNATKYFRAVVTGGACGTGTSAIVKVTVNPNLPASVTIAASPSGAICSGTSVTFTATPTNGGTTPTYQWYNGATPISGATSATYTTTTLANSDVIKVIMTSNASPCLTGSPTTSGTITMTVTQSPTVTAATSLASVCSGGNTTLTASTTPTTQNTILLYEGFNGASNTWTKMNNSTGSSSANPAWTPQLDGYSYTYPGFPGYIFHSNDNSQFYISNSASQGGGTTATILQSPAMNTTGYTSLSLNFYHVYDDYDSSASGDFARVQVSTNGTSWNDLVVYASDQGSDNAFSNPTINLNTYINQPTLYIRFKYDAQFDWFWAIDNVTISGNKTIDYTYSWAALPSGTAGLPSGAGTASTSNSSIVATPTVNTAYTVTATNPITGCTGTSTVNVSVNSNNWTGASGASGSGSWFTPGNWSCNTVPTSTTNVIIPNVTNKPVINDITKIAKANMVTVQSGSSLIVNSGNTLSLTDALINNGGALTFEDTSSLVQTSFTGANTGDITYKRASTTIKELDYTYWSSPVAFQNLLAVSPTTKIDKFFTFDATANDWVQVGSPSTKTMTVGQGYIIRGVPLPATPPPSFPVVSFKGVPNNGDITIAVVNGQTSNLIGNPYPSAIYADQFLFDNKLVIDGTIYFWTHNTAIQDRNLIVGTNPDGTPKAGSGALAYTTDDYAVYNLTGGVGTGSGTLAISSGPAIKPTGKIAAGQAFFTTSTAAGGTVKFTNTMRVDGSGNPLNNSNFYKTKNTAKTTNAIEKDRIWLNLTNTEGAFKQTLVGYITDATNDYDSSFDGESFDGNEFVDFYSVNNDKNLVIQGRALPFDENDEVPLGFRICH